MLIEKIKHWRTRLKPEIQRVLRSIEAQGYEITLNNEHLPENILLEANDKDVQTMLKDRWLVCRHQGKEIAKSPSFSFKQDPIELAETFIRAVQQKHPL